MNINEVIKYPILTEKTYAQMPNDVYTFAVDPRTNRAEVKKAIEFIFQVKVKKVNIIKIEKKPTKLGKSEGFTNRIKKAIITLSEGKINLYPDEIDPQDIKEDKTKADKVVEKPKVKEMSEVEKKAAAKIEAAKNNKDTQEVKIKDKVSKEATKETIKEKTSIVEKPEEVKKEIVEPKQKESK